MYKISLNLIRQEFTEVLLFLDNLLEQFNLSQISLLFGWVKNQL